MWGMEKPELNHWPSKWQVASLSPEPQPHRGQKKAPSVCGVQVQIKSKNVAFPEKHENEKVFFFLWLPKLQFYQTNILWIIWQPLNKLLSFHCCSVSVFFLVFQCHLVAISMSLTFWAERALSFHDCGDYNSHHNLNFKSQLRIISLCCVSCFFIAAAKAVFLLFLPSVYLYMLHTSKPPPPPGGCGTFTLIACRCARLKMLVSVVKSVVMLGHERQEDVLLCGVTIF